MDKRVCKKCGTEKELDEFYLSRGKHEWNCKECMKQKKLKRYYEVPGVKEKLMEFTKQKRLKAKQNKNEETNNE